MLYGRINGIDNISEAEIVEIVFQLFQLRSSEHFMVNNL